MWYTDLHGKEYLPIIILDIHTGFSNQIVITDRYDVAKKDLLCRSDGTKVLIEDVRLMEDLFESYLVLDVYVISNAGGNVHTLDVLNIGDELKLLGSTYEET